MRKAIRIGKIAVLALLIVCAALPLLTAEAALKRGSTGDEVAAVQKKLKQWGYYSGSVDGIFGYATERAVRWFQEKNGLTVDGVVGEKTAAAMGLNLKNTVSSSTKPASGDVYLLAQCIYSESRGEPYKGQVAVGAVVLNRVKSSSFPNSISGVVYQKGAFSAVDDGQINLTPNDSALKAAKDAMNGWDPTGGCLYYYNPAKTSNRWIRSRPVVVRIGDHVFCK
ncbi:MAG: spore cortex-lytic enzyme [Clostridia bacterium]|nr:spore cortex-lytic enzyme [Clostridia bacterium]